MSAPKVTVVSQANYPLTLKDGSSVAPGGSVRAEQDDRVQGYLDDGLLVVAPVPEKPETPVIKTPRANAQSDSEPQEK